MTGRVKAQSAPAFPGDRPPRLSWCPILHENGRWRDPDPLFTAGCMLVSSDDGAVDQLQRLRRFRCQCLEDPKPNARLCPPIEAVIDRRIRPLAFRETAPRR